MTRRTIEDKITFIMVLNKGFTLDSINGALVKEGIQVLNYLDFIGILVCQTGNKTYETMFQTQLESSPSKARQNGYTQNGYRELSPAKIPKSLEGKVYSVHLNYTRRIPRIS